MSCHQQSQLLHGLGYGDTNSNDSASKIPIKYNVTKLKNYQNPATPEWIDPTYTLPYLGDTPLCVPEYTCGDGSNGERWCYPDIDETFFTSSLASDVTFSVNTKFKNYYSQSNDTQSFSCNPQYGWRSILGQSLYFVGQYDYISRHWMKDDSMDWCCNCAGAGNGGFHHADYSPILTKYRTLTGQSNLEYSVDNYTVTTADTPTQCCCSTNDGCCPSCGCNQGDLGCQCTEDYCVYKTYADTTTYTAYGNAAVSVDIYGNISGSCDSGSAGFCEGADPEVIDICLEKAAQDGFSGVLNANLNYTTLQQLWCEEMRTWWGCEGCRPPDVLDWDETTGTGHAEWHTTIYDYDGCGCIVNTRNVIQHEMTLGTYHFESHTYGVKNIILSQCPCDGYVPDWVEIAHQTWDFGATAMDWEIYGFNPSWSNTFVGTRTGEGSLEDSYSFNEIYEDLNKNILSQWDLGSDAQLPWQTNINKTKVPWVGRDCGMNVPILPYCDSTVTYTGEIVGGPAPEGIDRVWNPSHPNYCVCDNIYNPGDYCMYIANYGQWSTDGCGVPRATRWTNTLLANNLMDGAFCGQGWMYTMPCKSNANGPVQIKDECVYAMKYAEVVFSNGKQSYNLIRPCESDRWQISASHSNCISSSDAFPVITIGDAPNNILLDVPVAVYGIGDKDGVYNISAVGANTITLGSQIVSSSQFPYNPWNEAGSGWVGSIRWTGVPGICGQAGIVRAEVVDTGSVEITLDKATWLVNHDLIEVHESRLIGLNGLYDKIKMLDPYTIFISQSGVTQPVGTVAKGGFVKEPFSPPSDWNSTTPKYQLVSKKWNYNFRDIGEYYRLSSSYAYEIDQVKCDPNPCGLGYADCVPCTPTPIPTNPRLANLSCSIPQSVTTQSCETLTLKYNHCGATAIYYSPNSESFVSGSQNAGWFRPGIDGPVWDDKYETLWQGLPQQLMDDPLAPYVPCYCTAEYDPDTEEFIGYNCNTCQYLPDDGTCKTDQAEPCINYYPSVDQFEAICDIPPGAPTLMPGTIIGCGTTQPPKCTNKNICDAPFSPSDFPSEDTCNPYLVNVFSQPWVLVMRKSQCVCEDGRFAEQYQRNGIVCEN